MARVNFPHIVNFNKNKFETCCKKYLASNILQAENVLKTKNLYDSYSKKIFYQNSEYEVQLFSFLAFKGEAVGVTHI
jgi:hypothetical protein